MHRVIHEIGPDHLEGLMRLFAQAWWSTHRTREQVVAMLAGSSVVVGVVDESNRLVGFSRVITDFVFRGTLYDVIVDETVRGTGVARILLDAVVNHPKLKHVEKIDLQCLPEKVALYEKWGWRTGDGQLLRMVRKRDEARANS